MMNAIFALSAFILRYSAFLGFMLFPALRAGVHPQVDARALMMLTGVPPRRPCRVDINTHPGTTSQHGAAKPYIREPLKTPMTPKTKWNRQFRQLRQFSSLAKIGVDGLRPVFDRP
jgi:hypothetical protein